MIFRFRNIYTLGYTLAIFMLFLNLWQQPVESLARILGYTLLSFSFGAEVRGSAGQGTKKILHLAWLLVGVSVVLRANPLLSILQASALITLLLITFAWHLYAKDVGRIAVPLAYVAALWSVAVASGGVIYVLWAVHVIALVVVLIKRGLAVCSEAIPVVWQAVLLYAMWLWLGTVAALIEGVKEVRPFFLEAAALPAALLIVWSLRHSLLRDGTAKSLAHFGVVLLLMGIGASSFWTTTTQVAAIDLELVGLRYVASVIRVGALLALTGGVLTLTNRE